MGLKEYGPMDDKEKIIAFLIAIIIYLLMQFIPTNAHADPTILIVNQTSIRHVDLDPAIAFVAQKFPIKIDFVYRKSPRHCPRLPYPAAYTVSPACYWAESVKLNHNGPVVFLAPTFSMTGAREAIGGIASVCDPDSGMAVVYYGNGLKFQGKLHTLLAHEIGHLMGANHDRAIPATFMHSAALAYDPLRYSRKSIEEMVACSNG